MIELLLAVPDFLQPLLRLAPPLASAEREAREADR